VASPAAALALFIRQGGHLGDLLLVGLALPAAWLRITLEPLGHMTLAPVVVAASLAVGSPWTPLAVAPLAAALAGGIARERPATVLFQAGEEAMAAASGLAVFGAATSVALPWTTPWILGLAAGVLAYVLARVGISAAWGRVFDRVAVGTFLRNAGRTIAVNYVLLSAAGVGLSYLVFRDGRVGYFALALLVVALVEAYHPYKLLSDQREALYASLALVARAIDLKDVYTGRHSRDASEIAVRIARVMGLPESEVRKIRFAGILHDIGKVGVDRGIIRKPASLTAEEMAAMREHPVIGARILQSIELLSESAEIVRHHHEHYDGSGYPDGLKGEEIPIGSRIVLVADAFNAMTTDRPYRRALTPREALRILEENAGTQFDPAVVRALKSVLQTS
jgi:putative nucleotidyltransferase with HDIG domain